MANSKIKSFLYALGRRGIISAKNMARLRYFSKYHRFPNIKRPSTLDEKILYLLFNTDVAEWTRLTDKYLVRDFVKERKEGQTLVELYGVYNRPEEIDWASLPDKFVVKTNNGSASVVLVDDKSKVNIQELTNKLNKWLTPFGYETGERHYFDIRPKIIIEQLLENELSTSSSIVDYKFWCFDGEPYLCFVITNRDYQTGHADYMAYSVDGKWTRLPDMMAERYANVDSMPKPKMHDELLRVARTLAKGFPLVRVDLYEVGDKVYFGEMTFTSNGATMTYFSRKGQMELGAEVKI